MEENNEDLNSAPESDGEDFAKLFEEQEQAYSTGRKNVIMGRVVSRQDDHFLMDIGLKGEGCLKAQDVPGGLAVEAGTVLPVVRLSGAGEGFGPLLSLKYAVRSLQLENIRRHHQDNLRLDAQIYRRRGDGFFIGLDIGPGEPQTLPPGLPPNLWKAFPYPAELPLAELDTDDPRPFHRWMGRKVQVKILEISGDGAVMVSRKKVVVEMKEALRQEALSSVKEGDILAAKVRDIAAGGVRLDISGVEAYLPQIEASWYPRADLSKRWRAGETIEVKILKKEKEKERFIVSRRALEANPADELEKNFSRGSIVEGMVSRVLANGGCFVRLPRFRREAYVPAGETVKDIPPKEGSALKAVVLKVDRENIRVILSPRRYEDRQMPEMVARYSKESQPFSLGQVLNPSGDAAPEEDEAAQEE
ncbi:MAG: S1 RNA-binding domain-containing protein [Elusimicrobia bacterium]|nr:S1 RNA-binding domain-containing protein [Elusimicrobiota bacterium]